MSASFPLPRIVDAIFNGVPSGEDVAPYTVYVTSLISIYICFLALFLVALWIFRLQKRQDLNEASKSFWIWMSAAMAFSILGIAFYMIYSMAIGV